MLSKFSTRPPAVSLAEPVKLTWFPRSSEKTPVFSWKMPRLIAPWALTRTASLISNESGGGEPGERVEPVLGQGVLDLGQVAGGDGAQGGGGVVVGAFQGGAVVRFQMRRDDETHPAAAQGDGGDPAGGKREPGAREVAGGAAVDDGGLQAGDEEPAHQVVAAGAVGELQREVGEVGHWAGRASWALRSDAPVWTSGAANARRHYATLRTWAISRASTART